MTLLFFILIATAFSAFYLSLDQQRWRVQGLPKKLRVLAVLLLMLALFFGSYLFSVGTTLLAAIVIGMLLLSLFPFLSLLKTTAPKKGESDGH